MEKHIDILHQSPLFRSVSKDEIKKLLCCLQTRSESYNEGDAVVISTQEVCIVTGGEIYVKDFNENTLHTYRREDCIFQQLLPRFTSLISGGGCSALFINTYKALTVCVKGCAYHHTFIRNLFSISNDKQKHLTERLYHLSRHTTKEKLLSYLKSISFECESDVFEIHMTRKELAEYLKVDRSAMTTELFSLQNEGYIEIDRNRFKLLK